MSPWMARAAVERQTATAESEPTLAARSPLRLSGPGAPLPAAARARLEPLFGHDFSKVRIHADEHGDAVARSLGAEGVTLGNEIAFREGRYAPETGSGRELLAHELTHVVQQGGERRDGAEGLSVADAERPAELEARAAARDVALGRPASPIRGGAPAAVQRQPSAKDEIAWERANPQGQVDVIHPGHPLQIPRPAPSQITLWNFAVGSSSLKPEHRILTEATIAAHRSILLDSSVTVVGHTSNTGGRSTNQRISLRRAKKTADFLVALGFNRADILILADGSAHPAVPNVTAMAQARNRRAEIFFSGMI